MSEQPTTPAPAPEQSAPVAQPEAPKPEPAKPEQSFTQSDVDRIVRERLAREGIADLKAKAAKFDELDEASKTAEQKAAEALAKAQRDAETLTLTNLRLMAAVDHGVDRDHRDLIGGTTPEEVNASAERLGALLRDRTERDTLKAELEALKAGKPAPSTVPVASLRPGASPQGAESEDDVLYRSLFGG